MLPDPPHNLTIVSPGAVFQEEMIRGQAVQMAYGREGSSLTFKCTTSAYYPNVSMEWALVADGQVMSYPVTPSQRDKTWATVDGKSYQMSSAVKIEMFSRHHLGFLRCLALHGDQFRVEKRVRLGIICKYFKMNMLI